MSDLEQDDRPPVVRASAYTAGAIDALHDVSQQESVRAQDVYDALGELKVGINQLPDFFVDLTRSLGRSLDAYRVEQTDGGDPAVAIATASERLQAAGPLLLQVWTLIDEAQQELADTVARPKTAGE